MGRFVPITYTTQLVEKTSVPKYTAACLGGTYGAKSYYDGKQCWQYKVVMDRPGNYCWQVPSTAICARTVLVGGGGKPKCISVNFDGSTCNSAAGAGGGYSEKCHAVTGGSTYFCIVVGRQEGTTSASCNGSAVHSASGASGMIPGTGTGGDWNSTGGCAGYTCNQCTGSYSHYCGSCKYFCFTTCCGYCIVYTGTDASTQTTCCNILVSGGASAGSPRASCGGNSSNLCGYLTGPVAGGGGGIGSGTARCNNGGAWFYSCCCCICLQGCANYEGFYMDYNGVPSAEGGGGSQTHSGTAERCRSWDADCIGGRWRGGNGGMGGPEGTAIMGWQFEWGTEQHCAFPYGNVWSPRAWECFNTPCQAIKQQWWDISDICGSGSPGVVASNTANACCGACLGWAFGPRPQNSGEGAGTGGWSWTCCDPTNAGNMLTNTNGNNGPLINFPIVCQLGICGWCDQSWLMQDALYPYFVTCAGTLGGSGGVGICGYMSKAGAGGGGGQAKCGIICVCYGAPYDCCNGTGPLLAFPPSLLDMQTSNAGTGLAIIYWREA